MGKRQPAKTRGLLVTQLVVSPTNKESAKLQTVLNLELEVSTCDMSLRHSPNPFLSFIIHVYV